MTRYQQRHILTFLLILLPLCSWAQTSGVDDERSDSVSRFQYRIERLIRTYGDSIRIRWAPESYVPWYMLNHYGYTLIRVDYSSADEVQVDTLATNLRPYGKEQFLARYAPTDSLAGAAAQILYGHGTRLDQTESAPGSAGSIMEVYDEQQNLFGMGMMLAELRPDLADALALGFTDRNVKPGGVYDYIVKSNVPDSIMKISTFLGNFYRNDPFVPEQIEVNMRDSILSKNEIVLFWDRTPHSAYDIERRPVGEEWQLMNDRPYVSMYDETRSPDAPNQWSDQTILPGEWEYRVRGYDSFGDRTAPSEPLRVKMVDRIAPVGPIMRRIYVQEIGDSLTLARILIHKEEVEPDFVGYQVYYSGKEDTDLEGWRELTEGVTQPRDSFLIVNVSGLPKGYMIVAAVDTCGNRGYSVPASFLVEDKTPPSAPTHLRAAISPEGVVAIGWSPSPEDDVMGYQVYVANDPSHEFLLIPGQNIINDTLFTDTISMDVMQRYIYYKVVAYDWSGNRSAYSEMLRKSRPNFDAPTVARLSAREVTDEKIRMTWDIGVEPDVVRWRLFRRLENTMQWTFVSELTEDSVRAAYARGQQEYTIVFEDAPEYNQTLRYHYAVECINETGVSSGLSMEPAFLFTGPTVLQADIRLYADYDGETKAVKLAWEHGRLPVDGDYYYTLFRRYGGDQFVAIVSLPKDEPQFTDFNLRQGETADYYVKIWFKDDRQTTPSNTVTLTAK